MKKLSVIVLIFQLLITGMVCGQTVSGQTHTNQGEWIIKDPFVDKVFIENKGQFNGKNNSKNAILFGAGNGGEQFYFTSNGFTYRLDQLVEEKTSRKHKNDEDDEKESPDIKSNFIQVEWINSNKNCEVIASDQETYHYAYTINNNQHFYNNRAFKKITYKNLYNNIDVEYTFHPEKGIKYKIILHSGAQMDLVKIRYTGNLHLISDSQGNVNIISKQLKLIDHAPVSFYENSLKPINSSFRVDGNEVSFQLENYDKSRSVIIDPWVVNPSFTTLNNGYDIDKDASGNVYVYGGGGNGTTVVLRKYTSAGALVWTYSPNFTDYMGDLAVDLQGNSYITYGCCSPTIRKIATNNTVTWSSTLSDPVAELWCLAFNCDYSRLYMGIGGTFSLPKNSVTNINLGTGAISGTTALNSNNSEPRAIAVAPSGNIHVLTVTGTPGGNVTLAATPAFAGVFSVANGYNLAYYGPAPYSNGVTETLKGQNGIAAGKNFFCTTDGKTLFKRNLTTGASLGQVTIPGGLVEANSGVIIDDCDNIYVGSQNAIYKYDANLAQLTSVSTTGAVYALWAGTNGEVLATGKGFVGSFNLSYSQSFETFTVSSTPAGCNCSGTTTLSVTGGCSTYSYKWSNGSTEKDLSGLCQGTYTVTATSLCTTLTNTVSVASSPCSFTVATTSNNICPGACNTITANGSGGTAPYTYSWSPGAGTGSSFNVCPASTTTYTVITTDNTGVTASNTAVVTVNPLPAVTISGTTTLCAGQNTTLTGSGGGTYSWNTGATTAGITVTPVNSTTYSLTVTTGGCIGSQSVAVTVNPAPIPTINGNTSICSGQSTTLTATGGGTYAWNTGATTAGITVSPTGNTTYSVVVTNTGCTGSASIAVTVAAGLSPTITGTTSICPGTSTTLTANSGGTYSWNTGETTAAITVSPSTATSYSVTVTSGSCTGTATVQVSILTLPSPTITGTTTICEGNSTTLTATSGGTYSWNTGATTTAITVSPAINTTYSVIATSSGGCTGSTQVAVTVNLNPAPTISGMTTICAGQSTTLTATGGGTYVWSTGDLTAAATVTPSATSTYTVTVTNNGCTGSATVQVTVGANLIPVITGTTTICNGGSTSLSTSGGGTYAWSDGTTSASITVSPTTTTSYSVTVTSSTCNGTATVQVTVVNNPTPTITGNTSVCSATSTTLTANGATSYVWDNGQTTASITVSPAVQTTYTVTANTSGCTGQTTVVVSTIPPPNPTITGATAICNGGSTTLTATGGGTYVWNTGATAAGITVTPSITTSYTVIVTTGCSASATVQVTVQASLVPNITGIGTICNGQSTTLSTSGGGTYAWSDGSTGPSITVSPTANTTYSVTVTNGLCSGTASKPVVVNPNPVPTITGVTNICSGQGAILMANGGGAYEWNTGATTAGITVSPSATTSYTVIVTTNGCTGSATAQVAVYPTPAPTITGITNICSGQSTTLTSSTSGPYSWNTGATTASITVTPTAATTTYSVSITANGCTGTAGQTVVVIPPVMAKIAGNDICAGESVMLTASGGTSYLWSTSQTINPITVSPSVTTTYSVVAAQGSCADTATYVVTVNPLPMPIASGDTTILYGQSTPLTSSGGGTYQWVPPAGLSCSNCPNPIATPTATTNYCVIIKTMAGCTDSSCVTVVVDLKCGFEGELFVPNGFSPNGDGQNDVLYVRGVGITNIYWAIFDRWGEKVFETTNITEGWDGTYKGKALDPAVFVYYLRVTCITGDEIKQKGNVAIIR